MTPIVVAGNVVLDVTVDVDLPSVPIGRQTPGGIGLQAGGGLPNVGALLERMGRTVRAVGAVGDDAAGTLIRQLLPWDLPSVPGATTEVSVIASAGERTIINAQGTATVAHGAFAKAISGAELVLFAYLNCCSLAVADIPAAVNAARRAGCRVIGGLNGVFSDERRHVVAGVLEQVDLVVLNREEAAWLSGTTTVESASGQLASLTSRVCITLGHEGLLVIDRGRSRRWRTEPIHDGRTLGAGDAFLAGVVAALADESGWDAAYERGLTVAATWVAGGQL